MWQMDSMEERAYCYCDESLGIFNKIAPLNFISIYSVPAHMKELEL
jgi:hypothetical protein